MRPYLQGALDGLCAVYTIVNAARIICDIDEQESRELFRQILAHLEKTKDLSRVLIEGVDLITIGGILGNVVDDKIRYRSMPFKHRPKTSLDQFWRKMMSFLHKGHKRAILICLSGPMWDHWSVVHSISKKQICFFDSHKLKRLNRNRCTTSRSSVARPHVLCPTHTYFLS